MGWPGPMTRRQFRAWESWTDEDLNRPGKLENYLMSVAAEVRRGYVKDARSVRHDHFRLVFGPPDRLPGEPVYRNADEASAAALARAKARVGGKIRIKGVDV